MDRQDVHLVILLGLLVVLSACRYFHIEPDQMVLGAILLALNVGGRPQVPPAEPESPKPSP